MTLHCPGWILCIFCANAARESLFYSAPLNVIIKKYTDEIAVHYNEISAEFLQQCSEKILGSLVEVEAGESAEEVIRGYLYQKVKFKDDGSIRKLVGLFSSEFKGERSQSGTEKYIVTNFRAFLFSLRSGKKVDCPPGWQVDQVPDLKWVQEVMMKKVSIMDL
tara:strand:+ start:420 stop:908 length:489 start_codon:yes stop_codon:yes gene_type:complete